MMHNGDSGTDSDNSDSYENRFSYIWHTCWAVWTDSQEFPFDFHLI
jgi:hypothetical protein